MRRFCILSAFLMMAVLAGASAVMADPLLDPEQDPFDESSGSSDQEVGEEMCAWPG